MLYAERIGPRLAIGWTMGTLVSAVGVYLSLKVDLPTGATNRVYVWSHAHRDGPGPGSRAADA
jgi:ABC-type Mn2+/Zn2+ transport system permease subunit